MKVSAPIDAATGTLHVSGVEPDAGVQLGDVGVRFATVGAPPPLTTIASDCVDGETYCGRGPAVPTIRERKATEAFADNAAPDGMRMRKVAVALLALPDPGGAFGNGWVAPKPPPPPPPLQLATASAPARMSALPRVLVVRLLVMWLFLPCSCGRIIDGAAIGCRFRS